jgi:tRNA 5-methylaminomethyl-2-thiouridine biosynthesis bifunctional protein
MSEPITWMPDGTPIAPDSAIAITASSAASTRPPGFLGGCDLPAAWADAAQWRILETGFGFGLNFLVTWAAWKADPRRPRILHFVSVEAYPVSREDLLAFLPADEDCARLANNWPSNGGDCCPACIASRLTTARCC